MSAPKKLLFILPEDRAWATARIAELEAEIAAMGPDFHAALTESNETWHDNAPFDALREKQAVLAAELQNLRELLRSGAVSLPKSTKAKVGIGTFVELQAEASGRTKRYFIAGDWTHRAGQIWQDARVVSASAPLALALLGRKRGESISLPPKFLPYTITQLSIA